MNTFVQPYIAGTQALVTCPLYDPQEVRDGRVRFRRDAIPLLRHANSFYIPTGREASRGWILLRRSDYNNINTYATNFQLNIGDPTQKNNVGTLKNLSIVQAQCVTRGLTSASNALYLVEVVDARGILFNEWFQFPINSYYNIRSPAYPQSFQLSSMNTVAKAPWTWTTMLQDMWNKMSILGPWPGLPSVPSGTPEGFWFPGVSAWPVFNDILDHFGFSVACDLTQTNPFTVIASGAVDNTFTNLQTKYITNLEDDLEWIDTGAGRVPVTLNILFRRRNAVYGTEETVTYRNDSLAQQWDMGPIYTVSGSAPITFSKASGTHYIWSDFTVRYDQDNNPMAADVATANIIASERIIQYFAKIYRQTAGSMHQVYTGALPFVTGAQVDGVCYYQNYNDQNRHGWKTKIIRGEYPPFPEIME